MSDVKYKVFDITFDEEMEFNIVGSTEANSLEGKISNESPVGQALMGKKVGETVDVETQAGVIEYKVLDTAVMRETRPLYYKGSSFAFREYKKCTGCPNKEGENIVSEQQKKAQQEPDLNQLRKVRREKLADLQANGKDPFVITKYDQTHHSMEIKENFEET